MKIITCASYHGTGSSAVTDMMTEYQGVKSLGEYEFTFAHATDGLSDLEFHLVECQNRHSSGHALKRFERLSKFNAGKWFNKRYEPFFNGQYWEITKEYIDKLLNFKIKGQTFYDSYDRGVLFYYLQNFVGKIFSKVGLSLKTLPNEYIYYSFQTQHDFLELTKDYTSKLLLAANDNQSDYLMVDQLIPSTNINRCLRYFDENLYVFLVDRDPRDVYLSNKYVWREDVVPTDPADFCQWFRYTHETTYQDVFDESRVMKLRFEDLVYNYEITKGKIEKFIGLDPKNQTDPFSKMNPKRSVVNTQQWKKFGSIEEVKYIGDNLSEYLFPFEKYEGKSISGITPSDNKSF